MNIREMLISEKLLSPTSGKISPWLNRKISKDLLEIITDRSGFLIHEYSLADRILILLSGVSQQPKCVCCGTPTKFHKSINKFSDTCNNKNCTSPDTISKRLDTIEEKYGVRKFFHSITSEQQKENSIIAQRASIDSIQKKYGVDNIMKIPGVKETHLRNVHRGKRDSFDIGTHFSQKHYSDKMIWAINNLDEIYKEHIDHQIPITVLSRNYGFSGSFLFNKMKDEYDLKQFSGSLAQRELFAEFEHLGAIQNDRKAIAPKEIDIFFPTHKVGIEVDGVFWHSKNHTKTDRYHKEKMDLANLAGIRLLRFTTEELSTKKDIVSSMILNALRESNNKIFARKTSVRIVSKDEEKEFFNKNHIQGFTGSSIALGLEYNNQLVFVVSFGKPRYNKSYDWEIIRSSSLLGTNVVGGFSKILTNFIEMQGPSKIISYVDLRFFTGSSLLNCGFKHVKNTDVGYYYTSDGETLQNRLKFQKHKLGNILSNFDVSLTEKQNMINNGYRIFYDCGQAVFHLT